jgi:hypothetical protein
VVHKRVATTSEWLPQHQRGARAATQHNTTTNYYTVRNNIVLFRSVAIIYIYYFYLAGAGVMPNLTITAVVPLCAHLLRRRLTLLTATTLLFSNQVRYLTNCQSLLYAYVLPFTGLALCKRVNSVS